MGCTNISFISCRKRAITLDLKLVKNYLAQNISEIEFSYFTKSENTLNPMTNQGIRKARLDFCQDLDNIICIDASLSGTIPPPAPGIKRLLISIPFDYQFQEFLAHTVNSSLPRKKTFKNFTHILTGSPFGSDLLKRSYEINKIQVIDNICLPLSWDIVQKKNEQSKKRKFEFYYPCIKNKKIFSIITVGEKEDIANSFQKFNLEKFLNYLGDSWFVFTNSKNLLNSAIQLSSEYNHSFGYIDSLLPALELLYFSDVLITNYSKYATCFAIKRKPVYYLKCADNMFGTYIHEYYPNLYLDTLDCLFEIPLENEQGNNIIFSRFSDEFSYPALKDPFEVICNLFQ